MQVRVEFLEKTGEFSARQNISAGFHQLPAGSGIVVIGNGNHITSVFLQAGNQVVCLQPGFRKPQNSAQKLVCDIGIAVMAVQVHSKALCLRNLQSMTVQSLLEGLLYLLLKLSGI
jgi:hypothetical protein